MGRRLNIVFLATIAMAVLLQNSSAQTTYVVGDALGWVVPPGSSVYTTWAANKTFRVGDTLGKYHKWRKFWILVYSSFFFLVG